MQNNQGPLKIEFCSKKDLTLLQRFLNEDWKKNHILAKNTRLMNWQHYNKNFNRYNFIISRNNRTGSIEGILGYIPNKHFDNNIKSNEIFLAIWKVIDNVSESMLGMKLIKFLSEKENPDLIFTTGLNISVLPFYKRMGYTTGFLNHYYIVNNRIEEFQLIEKFSATFNNKDVSQDDRKLKKIHYDDLLNYSVHIEKFCKNNYKPTKSFTYIINKYQNNPFYDYLFYSIIMENNLIGICIIRIAEYNRHRALRLVEFIGLEDSLMNLGEEFQKLLDEYHAEYIDFYNKGLKHEYLSSSGFLLRKLDSEIIVPNYFEPFEKKNVNIAYAINTNDYADLLLFKGEGDQDRPNQIK